MVNMRVDQLAGTGGDEAYYYYATPGQSHKLFSPDMMFVSYLLFSFGTTQESS